MAGNMLRTLPTFGNPVCPVTTNTLDRRSFENVEENLATAETLISRWDTKASSKMLFQSTAEEIRMYMETVENLQRLMEYLSAAGTNGPDLFRAQRLMKTSMSRLQNEFHKILLSNSEPINPVRESSSTEDSIRSSACSDGDGDGSTGSSADCLSTDRIWEFRMVPLDAVVDLRSIAHCMVKSGYASECLRVFTLTRKSVVEESLYNLGVEKLKLNDVRKMEWKFLDEKIKKWIYAAKISIRILFPREKQLCGDVFEGVDKMRDSCFAEIAMKQTTRLFAFAEAVAATSRAPERIFRVLDLYQTLTDLMPDIEDTYSHDPCRSAHEQAEKILEALDEVARRLLGEFDKAIEKDNSKAPVAGGIVHPLTRYVMNSLTFLSDYKETLETMTGNACGELPDDFDVDNSSAPLSVRLGWTVFLLMCKLEKKSDLYKDVALSYLFLMNNLHYIVQKVNGSELKYILGENWVRKQWNKVTQYAVKYERATWMKVLSCLIEKEVPASGVVSSGEGLKERIKGFNSAMEEVKKRHDGWVVADISLREKLRVSITEKLITSYSSFITRFRSQFERDSYIKYTAEELQLFVSDMFKGIPSSVSSTRSR